MRIYVVDHVKLSNGKHLVSRYTPEEYIAGTILKFFLFLFIIWPFQIFIWWPLKFLFKLILIIGEIVLRGIWWLIRLPFCELFTHKPPEF